MLVKQLNAPNVEIFFILNYVYIK